MPGEQTPPIPEQFDDLSSLIDETPAHEESRIRFRLGEMQRHAIDANDAERQNTIRCEGNVFLIFDGVENLEAFQHATGELLYENDLPYLRERLKTPNLRARARYLHAIALITKRFDDGQASGRAYLEAFREYSKGPRDAGAFSALRHIIPLAKLVCQRYKLSDEFKDAALTFLLDSDDHFVHLKAELFQIVVSDAKMFNRDDLLKLRQYSLDLLHAIRGGDDKEITKVAELGRKLADRLGESYDPWYEAEAAALEARIAAPSHPMLTEIVGTRLIRLYQLLRDDRKRQDTIQRMREARAKMEYVTFSGQPDNWSEQVEYYQQEARRFIRERGAPATLLWLATTKELMPSAKEVRNQLDDMEAKGIGIFRELATTIVSSDQRILSENAPGEDTTDYDFNEQYGFWWSYAAVLPFSIFMSECVPTREIRLDQIERFLTESWIGQDEEISYGGDVNMPNDLVRLLMPGVRIYFQLLTSEAREDAIVPAIDTLVLRFEAVLRKLARMLDVPSIRGTDKRGRPLAEHAGLELLENQRIRAACGPDLVAFAKHTLVQEPEGLRDRVGHAILHYAQYRMIDLAAVVMLILRFAGVAIVDVNGNPKPKAKGHQNS